MKVNQLSNSDLKVSEIALGAMSLMQDRWNDNKSIIDLASSIGINFIDTSDLYDKGLNEVLVGKLIKDQRDQWIIGSKVGNKWNSDGTGWDWVPSKKYIFEAIDLSLNRLGLDYLDYYQLHGGTNEDPFDEIVDAFEELVKLGKIRYYGISSIRPNVFLKYAKDSNIIANLMQFSLLDRRPLAYLDQFEKNNVSVISRGAIAQGLLNNKDAKAYLNYTKEQINDLQLALNQIAEELNVSALTLAIKYPLIHSSVKSVLIGIRTLEQMKELELAIQDFDKINPEYYNDLLNSLPINHYKDHLI